MSPAQAPSGMGCSLLRCPSPAPPLFPIGRATCLVLSLSLSLSQVCSSTDRTGRSASAWLGILHVLLGREIPFLIEICAWTVLDSSVCSKFWQEIEFQRWTNACCTCRVTIYFALVLCRQSSPAHPWHRCCHCSAGEGLERIQFGDFPLLFLCAPFHPSLMRDVLPILFKGHVMGTPAPAAAPLPFLLW